LVFRSLGLLTLVVLVIPFHLLGGQDAGGTLREEIRLNRRLETLNSLVQEKKLYVVFHFPRKVIEFRIRGLLLRTLPIRNMLLLGKLPANYTSLILRIKETDRPPVRDVIDPQKESEPKGTGSTTTTSTTTTVPSVDFTLPDYNSPEFLELKDMPNRYNLFFDTGFAVMFRPEETPSEEKGFFRERWQQLGIWWSDAQARMRRRLGKTQVPPLRLTLSDEDCRLLFWSLPEGGKALFITLEDML